MSPKYLRYMPIDKIAAHVEEKLTHWLWTGYLFPGDVTLLTSQWKAGKTTLVTGLLRRMAKSGAFLGQSLRPGRAMVISEESPAQWSDRLRDHPIGPHVQLATRPFRGRPSVDAWNELIDEACDVRRSEGLDLLVVDPLASFLPGRCESDAGGLLEALQPLHRLAVEGVAILLLHHPRKAASEIGSAARGSGALLGFVDIVLELHRYSRLKSDFFCRQLHGLSRKSETPARLAYEWNEKSHDFTVIVDAQTRQFEKNWPIVLQILQHRTTAATQYELLADWPADEDKPCATILYRWLNRAFEEKRIRRVGQGTRDNPWRYRLENEDDAYYDRGELPPIRPLSW